MVNPDPINITKPHITGVLSSVLDTSEAGHFIQTDRSQALPCLPNGKRAGEIKGNRSFPEALIRTSRRGRLVRHDSEALFSKRDATHTPSLLRECLHHGPSVAYIYRFHLNSQNK
ncbi:hypothetical protein SKAU_G00333770 [Synaphobranchus kaupii]|uniref:Uncharacterized protein n=1 Tax=Synaphobranchus kaupii TaxID=118154 RepID=A0A9Q1IIQ4_SYNKA|nr:hypothetical protein SKAU_G00333770 [Synaphobranchus kaupii]